MTRSLEDPTFAGRVESVDADLAYRVEFDGRSTETYQRPRLRVPRARRGPTPSSSSPSYTALEPKTVEDIRHVTAVEGTELTLLCRLNKDVAAARLVDEKGQAIALTPPDEGDATSTRATFTLADSHRYKVQLVDREGRPNKLPAEIVVNVTRNRPPVVTMTQPAHDVRVSPVEELHAQGPGRRRLRRGPPRPQLHARRARSRGRSSWRRRRRRRPRSVAGRAPARLRGAQGRARPARHLLLLGRGHRPRRQAAADLGRHVLRRGPPLRGDLPPGRAAARAARPRAAGASRAATPRRPSKLAELQKQIINGTWKLIRRETGAKPTDDVRRRRQDPPESQHVGDRAGRRSSASSSATPTSKASLEQAVDAR